MDEHTATALLGPSASVACVRHSLPCRLCRSSMRSVSRPAIARLAVLTAVTVLLAALAACDLGEPKPPVPVQQQAQAVPAPAPPVAPKPVPQGNLTVPHGSLPVPFGNLPAPPGNPPPPSSLPAPHEVAPPSAEELQRKRAEWQELQRTQDQARSELEAWRRSRRLTESKRAVPRVGDGEHSVIVDYGESKSAGESERVAGAMRAWYRHYSARSAAVSKALSQYGIAAAANPPDPSLRRAACRELLVFSQALLGDPQALPAPLDNVSAPLSTAYTEIQAFASSCLASRQDEQAAHLEAAHRAMDLAGTALRPYRMTP